MSLPGPDRTVQHEGIRPLSGRLDNTEGGGMGDAVARSDDEVSEAVPAALGLTSLWSARRGGFWRFLLHDRSRLGAGCLRGACLDPGLFLTGGLEELRIDDKADLHGLSENLGRGRADPFGKGLLQPF